MNNVSATIEGKKLTLVIDLSKNQGPSASGKSEIIATTKGNIELEGHDKTMIGLNVFKSLPKEPKAKKTVKKNGKKRVTFKVGK